ncbi:YeeE/YedE thiosulfate transporter family protein, partial [Corynebacterium sp.]
TTIHDALHISPWILVAVLWVVTFLLWRHYRAKDAGRPKVDLGQPWYAKPLNMNVAAVLVGIIGTVGFVLSANAGRNGGLGITTPTADIVRGTATGDSARMNWGTLLVIGLLVGAFIAAKTAGEFRVRVPDAQTATRAIWGGIMMGVGASLAGGCTVGNGMVETSLFSFQGWVALFFMALGVGAGARLWLKPKSAPLQPQTYSTEESVDNSVVSAEDKGLPSFATATGAVALKTKPEAKNKARALGGGRYALDTLGAVCPFPLIEAKQVMAELEPGEALVIDFDCTQATESIPQWAADEGHKIRDFHRSGDAGWQVTVVKGG